MSLPTSSSTVKHANSVVMVLPGQVLGDVSALISGEGTYDRQGLVRAALHGYCVEEDVIINNQTKKYVHVIGIGACVSDSVISVSDIVICRVTRILANQMIVDILMIEDRELKYPIRGIVRREDMRPKEVDKIVISDLFRVGDLIRSSVLSLGDSKYYYLSTAADNLGVCYAKSENSNAFLIPSGPEVCWS